MLTFAKNKKIILCLIAAVAVIAVVIAVFLIPKSGEKDPRELIDLGMQYLNNLDYETAILYFREALQIDPMNEEARNALAETYQRYGDYLTEQGNSAKAEEMYRKQEELLAGTSSDQTVSHQTEDPSQSYAAYVQELMTEGRQALADRNYDEAIHCFEKVLTIDPTNAEARKLLEETYWEFLDLLSDGRGAEEAIERVCRSLAELLGVDVSEIMKTVYPFDPSEVVVFDDPVLEKWIRRELDIPTGDITVADGRNLTMLYAQNPQDGEITSIAALQYFTNLKDLSIQDNQIRDLSPLQGLKKLKYINLQCNPVSDLSPLQGLTKLEQLHLLDNQVSDLSPLQGLTNLTVLHLSNNQIRDLGPLQGMTKLLTLGLDMNQISDISPLKGLTSLTNLYLSENQISDLSPLQGLKNLTELGLSGNQIRDISPLRELTELTCLYLEFSPVTDFSPVENLPNLKSFYHD